MLPPHQDLASNRYNRPSPAFRQRPPTYLRENYRHQPDPNPAPLGTSTGVDAPAPLSV